MYAHHTESDIVLSHRYCFSQERFLLRNYHQPTNRIKYLILLLSSNRKYDQFAIVYGLVMKQWYALYSFLYSYKIHHGIKYILQQSRIFLIFLSLKDIAVYSMDRILFFFSNFLLGGPYEAVCIYNNWNAQQSALCIYYLHHIITLHNLCHYAKWYKLYARI